MTSRCRSRELGAWLRAASLALGVALGCSARATDEPKGNGSGGAAASSAASNGGSAINLGGEVTTPAEDYARPCPDPKDLRCLKVDCPADSSPSTTSVSGTVYDPAGRVPLYNAVVYVVDPALLKPLNSGAQCESCSANFPASALAVALTDAQGNFKVTDMPVGERIPLVIQLGKWRRVVEVKTEACTNTVIEADKTRLPRNSSEGALPRIAMATGHSDALECLLRKIGIDESEFSNDSGDGHVHLYSGYQAAKEMQQGGKLVPLSPAEELWADSDKMLGYDMMLLGCEGDDNLWNGANGKKIPSDALPRPPAMHLEVRKYADLGGRIFGSHWHHRWINSDDVTPDDAYPVVAEFATPAGAVNIGTDNVGKATVSVDTSFPKGAAFQEWLFNVKASTKLGELPLFEAEHTVDSVMGDVAQRWIYGTDEASDHNPDMVQYFSFTTPVGEAECGRMVFSDVHVSFGGEENGGLPFPERCDASPDGELSPQEKALEFMIFDLSSCIQKERDEVPMPIKTVVK